MQVAVRSYLTAGVAVVGAGAIAVAPLSPVVPTDLRVPAVEISAPVNLTAAVNPIAAYFELVQNTVGSIAGLGEAVLANPAPILRQVITNQLATAGELLAALQTAGGELVNNLNTIGLPALRDAAAAIAAGNFVGAASNLVTAIVQPPLFAALPLLPALQAAFERPVANLLAVTQQLQTIVALAGFGLLSPVSSTIYATGQAIQNVFDAAKAGDPLGALGALMAAPAVIIDGFLNGYGADSGLLSPGLGPIGALLQIRDLIANAITPQAAAAVPTAAAATVTLSTEATEAEAVASTEADATAAGSPDPSSEGTGAATEEPTAEEGTTEEDTTATEPEESGTDETATDEDATTDEDASDENATDENATDENATDDETDADDAGSGNSGTGDSDHGSSNSDNGSSGSGSSGSGSSAGSGSGGSDNGGSGGGGSDSGSSGGGSGSDSGGSGSSDSE